MAEQGDFELFSGPAPSEKKEMSDEKFQEEMRRAQQQLAQLQQEEGQARAQDHNLARIIVQFLSQPGNTDLFLLISRCVGQDIPSELLLAILSLVDEKASQEVKGYLESPQAPAGSTALTVAQKADFQTLPPEQKKTIDDWITSIYQVGSKKPHRVLESVLVKRRPKAHETGHLVSEISSTLVQLSAFILRNYLTTHKIDHDFERLHEFMQNVFVGFVKSLEEQVKGQKQIK